MLNVKEAQRYLAIAAHDYRVLCMLAQPAANGRASDSSGEDTTDWQVVLLYYILCIQVKALACCRGKELQDHYTIKQWLNSENDLLPIARPYRKAEEWSRDARYEGRTFGKDELARYVHWFRRVHEHIGRLLSAEGVAPPTSINADLLISQPE